MACNLTFDNAPSTGVLSGAFSTNGIFEYLGYSTSSSGPFGAGGNWPWSTESWGAAVDTNTITPGFYEFRYKSPLPDTDPCYGEITFVVAIVQGALDVPDGPIEIQMCSGDAARNIFDDSTLFDKAAVNPVDCSIGGNGTASPGYSDGGTSGDITDDTYDPSAEATYPVTRDFEITYTPTAPAGYTLSGCDNCQPKTITVRYTVTEAFEVGSPSNIAACNEGDV